MCCKKQSRAQKQAGACFRKDAVTELKAPQRNEKKLRQGIQEGKSVPKT